MTRTTEGRRTRRSRSNGGEPGGRKSVEDVADNATDTAEDTAGEATDRAGEATGKAGDAAQDGGSSGGVVAEL
jgi:hypothetical protein